MGLLGRQRGIPTAAWDSEVSTAAWDTIRRDCGVGDPSDFDCGVGDPDPDCFDCGEGSFVKEEDTDGGAGIIDCGVGAFDGGVG